MVSQHRLTQRLMKTKEEKNEPFTFRIRLKDSDTDMDLPWHA